MKIKELRLKDGLWLFLIIIFQYNVNAKEYSNRGFNFLITISPSQGWDEPQILDKASGKLTEPIKYVLVSTNKDSGSRLSIQIMKVGDNASVNDPRFRKEFKKSFLESFQIKSRIVSEKISTIAGVPSFELVLQSISEEPPINVRLIEIIANGYQYNLIAMSKGTAQLSHPELDAALISFRFIEPPILPNDSSATTNFGRVLGRISGYVLILVIIGYIVYRIRKKRNKPKL